MSTPTLELANSVVQTLNDATWSISFIAKRKYIPRFTLKELEASPMIAVVPKNRASEIGNGTTQRDFQIDIGVFRYCGGVGVDEDARDAICDVMVEFVETIESFWMKKEITIDDQWYIVTGADATPIYDRDMLNESSVFGSVLTLTMESVR